MRIFYCRKIKERAYGVRSSDIHFWRNRQGSEVDFVESINPSKEIFAYECKRKEKPPSRFVQNGISPRSF